MKNLLLAFFATIFSFTLFAQEVEHIELPLNDDDKVEYQEVIEEPGSSNELYNRAMAWFKDFYTNPNAVIEEADNDDDKAKIKGKHSFNLYHFEKGKKNRIGLMKYNIKLEIKEGRYRYSIDDIFLHRSPKLYVEEWMNEDDPDRESYNQYLKQVDEFMQNLIASLKEGMAKPNAENAEDDW